MTNAHSLFELTTGATVPTSSTTSSKPIVIVTQQPMDPVVAYDTTTLLQRKLITMSDLDTKTNLTVVDDENAAQSLPTTNSDAQAGESVLTSVQPIQEDTNTTSTKDQTTNSNQATRDTISEPPSMTETGEVGADKEAVAPATQGKTSVPSTASPLYHASKHYAGQVGLDASALLVFLSGLQKGATKIRDGKRYFFLPVKRVDCKKASSKTYRAMTDYIKWMEKSAIHNNIGKLKERHLIETLKGQNRLSKDHTIWYHVPNRVQDHLTKLQKKHDNLYFDPKDAAELGLRCALVLNVVYRNFKSLSNGDPELRLEFCYSTMARQLVLHESTVRAAMKMLYEKGYVSIYLDHKGKPLNSYELKVPNPLASKGFKKRSRLRLAKLALGTITKTREEIQPILDMLKADNDRLQQKPTSEGLKILTEMARKDHELWQEHMQLKREKKYGSARRKGSPLLKNEAPEIQPRKRRTRAEIKKSKAEDLD